MPVTMTDMQMFVGLGNPGKPYQLSRHNIGFMVLDFLQKKTNLPNFSPYKKWIAEISQQGNCLLVKPQTFMNASGDSVSQIVNFYKLDLSKLYVVHDDLDLELGKYKINFGKGPKVHNGLLSIYDKLGSDQFWHVRVGVDGRGGVRQISPKDYVLMPFSEIEQPVIKETITQVTDELSKLCTN